MKPSFAPLPGEPPSIQLPPTSPNTLLTPHSEQATLVRETREIRHNGALVANPTTEFSRANGTFTSALPITIPSRAGRGAYEVTTTVAAGDRVSRDTTTFTVN